MSEIENKVNKIIVRKVGVDMGKVKPEATFDDDLGADSLDKVEVLMEIEDAFDIHISDEEALQIKTVKDLYDYLSDKV